MTSPATPDSDYTIYALGDSAMTISLGEQINPRSHAQIMAMRQWITANPFDGLIDCITAYSSLTVLYNVSAVKTTVQQTSVHACMNGYLEKAYRLGALQTTHAKGRLATIPVCYDDALAPD